MGCLKCSVPLLGSVPAPDQVLFWGDSEVGVCPSKALVRLGCCKSPGVLGPQTMLHPLSELWHGTSQSRDQGHTEWCLEEPALFSCSAGPGEGLVSVRILPQVLSSAAAGAPGALLGDHSLLRDQQHSVSSWCLPCIPFPQHCPVMSLPSIIHAFISIPYWLALPPGALFSSSGPQHVGMSSRKAHCA